jgi:hypothetical protein
MVLTSGCPERVDRYYKALLETIYAGMKYDPNYDDEEDMQVDEKEFQLRRIPERKPDDFMEEDDDDDGWGDDDFDAAADGGGWDASGEGLTDEEDLRCAIFFFFNLSACFL